MGTVESFDLSPDRSTVVMRIQMSRKAEPLLTEGASVWVVKPRLFAGDIVGLSTPVSGSSMEMSAGEQGKPTRRDFIGLKDPPALAAGIVTVRSFGVPRYLEWSEIMQASGPGRLVASGDDWWAEALRVMLCCVDVGDLAQRLPNSIVLKGGGTIGARADAGIEFDLQRFERDEAHRVSMLGNIAIQRGGTRTIERVHFPVPVAGPTMRDQVNAMSTALGQAVDLTATRLVQ